MYLTVHIKSIGHLLIMPRPPARQYRNPIIVCKRFSPTPPPVLSRPEQQSVRRAREVRAWAAGVYSDPVLEEPQEKENK